MHRRNRPRRLTTSRSEDGQRDASATWLHRHRRPEAPSQAAAGLPAPPGVLSAARAGPVTTSEEPNGTSPDALEMPSPSAPAGDEVAGSPVEGMTADPALDALVPSA